MCSIKIYFQNEAACWIGPVGFPIQAKWIIINFTEQSPIGNLWYLLEQMHTASDGYSVAMNLVSAPEKRIINSLRGADITHYNFLSKLF